MTEKKAGNPEVVCRFVKDECHPNVAGGSAADSSLYNYYRKWVKRESIPDAPKMSEFYSLLTQLGFPERDGRRKLSLPIQLDPEHILAATAEVMKDHIKVTVTKGWKPWLVEAFKKIPGYWFHADGKPKYWSFPIERSNQVRKALRYVSVVEWHEDGEVTTHRCQDQPDGNHHNGL